MIDISGLNIITPCILGLKNEDCNYGSSKTENLKRNNDCSSSIVAIRLVNLNYD